MKKLLAGIGLALFSPLYGLLIYNLFGNEIVTVFSGGILFCIGFTMTLYYAAFES